jgi:formylglycine-generating enzyme required for sulfatase activity
MAQETFRRHGLVLPTEAQWEFAMRARTTTPWPVPDRRALADVANLYDRTSADAGFLGDDPEDWNDGFVRLAPVGRFAPNGFGIHDMAGNVWEWCRDRFRARWGDLPRRPGDGELLVPADETIDFIARGGSFGFNALHARSAARAYQSGDSQNSYWGVRAARPVLPD